MIRVVTYSLILAIFLKFATVQEINAKKKTASDCCMHCGEEMKKSVQC